MNRYSIRCEVMSEIALDSKIDFAGVIGGDQGDVHLKSVNYLDEDTYELSFDLVTRKDLIAEEYEDEEILEMADVILNEFSRSIFHARIDFLYDSIHHCHHSCDDE